MVPPSDTPAPTALHEPGQAESAITAITVICPPYQAERLGELIWTLPGVQSLEMRYNRHEQVQSLVVYSDAPDIEPAIVALIASQPKLTTVCAISQRQTIAPSDWAESWKQHWQVSPITDRLTICPSWLSYSPARPDEIVIQLDPGCAFGTGTHETTRLMLTQLEALSKTMRFEQLGVLDVGTGSGILAIAAAKFGARSILAIDTDPLAVSVAAENAARNAVGDRISVSDTPLQELCRTPYDVMLVNIIAPVILELLPELQLRLAPGGILLASGLIETTVAPVAAAITAAGLTVAPPVCQGDWYALQARRHL